MLCYGSPAAVAAACLDSSSARLSSNTNLNSSSMSSCSAVWLEAVPEGTVTSGSVRRREVRRDDPPPLRAGDLEKRLELARAGAPALATVDHLLLKPLVVEGEGEAGLMASFASWAATGEAALLTGDGSGQSETSFRSGTGEGLRGEAYRYGFRRGLTWIFEYDRGPLVGGDRLGRMYGEAGRLCVYSNDLGRHSVLLA